MKNITHPPIYILSGGQGHAGHTLLQSLLVQYPNHNISVVVIPNITNIHQLDEAIEKARQTYGIIVHTMVNAFLRQAIIDKCIDAQIRQIDLMGELASYLEEELGLLSVNVPGLFRRINAQYYQRVEAIEFSMNHDDGINPQRLFDAEIILTGVSRVGKTPLSVYMSMLGWKVANIPLVNGIPPPPELFQVDPRRVFGLSINADLLLSHRHKRISNMGPNGVINYVDPLEIKQELRYANLIFDKGGFTIINVTNKPIESSANEILNYMSQRFGYEEHKMHPEI
jgi:regulator of PEP synthase PpsR (kinase-PPPase family)